MTVRTMQAPARMTSARLGCNPTICRRAFGGHGSIQLDLPVHFGAVDDRSLHPVGIVPGHPVHHRREIGHRTAHADKGLRRRGAVDGREIGGDGSHRPAEVLQRDGLVEVKRLGVSHRADVQAELAIDARSLAERELTASSAGVEDHERPVGQPQPRLHGEVGDPALVRAGDDLDRHPAALLDKVEEFLAVGGGPQAHGADGGDALDPEPGGLLGHSSNRGRRFAPWRPGRSRRFPGSPRPAGTLRPGQRR